MTRLILFVVLVASAPALAIANLIDTEPETRSSPLIATPQAVKLEPFVGGIGYAYVFDAPPGTGGLTPDLRLSYSSLTKGSEYGWGWSLNLSVIERSTRFGPPDYTLPGDNDSGDQYELDGALLVADPDEPNRYHRERIDFTKIVYHEADDSWTVFAKDGTRMRYGARAPVAYSRLRTAPTIQDTPTNNYTFRWALDEVIDARGNSIHIDWEEELDPDPDYATHAVNLHPRRIRYSYHETATLGSRQDHRLVEFRWGPRADVDASGTPTEDQDRPTSFRSGFKVQMTQRLLEVVTALSPDDLIDPLTEQIDRYVLSYAPKTAEGFELEAPFSKLIEIQRYGRADEAFPTKTTFGYKKPPRDYEEGIDITQLTEGEDIGSLVTVVGKDALGGLWDLNGDGIPDRVKIAKAPGKEWEVSFGLPPDHPSSPGFAEKITWKWCDTAGLCSDTPPAGEPRLILQRKTFGVNPLHRVVRRDLIDMNADGLLDRVVAENDTDDWSVYFNQGCDGTECSFAPPTPWRRPQVSTARARYINATRINGTGVSETARVYARIVDLDGDGAADHLSIDGSQMYASWNRTREGGTGFSDPEPIDGSFDIPWLSRENTSVDTSTVPPSLYAYAATNGIFDANDDGFPDLVFRQRITTNPKMDCLVVGFSTGDGFPEVGAGLRYPRGAKDCRPATTSGDFSSLSFSFSTFVIYDPFNQVGWYDRWETVGVLDYNGDGVVDRATTSGVFFGLGDGTYASHPVVYQGPFPSSIRYSTGNPGIPFGTYPTIAQDTADINGDGLVDRILASKPYTDQPGKWTAYLHPGHSGVLETVTNEMGGTTRIEYASSVSFVDNAARASSKPYEAESHGAGVALTARPFAVPVRITTSDGVGGPDQVVEVQYAEPRYDHERRENLGFRMTEQISGTAEPVMSRSLFHQAPERLGQAELEEVLTDWDAPNPVLFEARETEWEVLTPTTEAGTPIAAFFAVPTSVTTKTYADPLGVVDPAPEERVAQVRLLERVFETTYGNLLVESARGAPGGSPHDDLSRGTIYRTRQEMNGEWMVGYPAWTDEAYYDAENGWSYATRIETHYLDDGTGRTERVETTIRNDLGLPEQTRVERISLDAFGNALFQWEPRFSSEHPATDHTNSTTYETEFNTFLSTSRNPKGHAYHWRWDPGRGLVEKSLDARSHLSCWDYDAFGRLSARSDHDSVVTPAALDSVECDTVLDDFAFERLGDPDQRLKSRRYISHLQGSSSFVESFEYFDGLGRTYKETSAGRKVDGSAIQQHFVTYRSWDDQGRQICQSLPIDADPEAGWSCDTSTSPVRVTRFDAIGRPLEQRLMPVDRLESTSAYFVEPGSEPLLVTETTTKGVPDRVERIKRDAKGNVVEIDETPAGGVTTFEVDPFGRITLVDGPDIDVAEPGPAGLPHDENLLFLAYNSLGQRIRVARPRARGDGTRDTLLGYGSWKYSYDEAGNLVSSVSKAGTLVQYAYDELNRLVLRDQFPFDPYSQQSDGDVHLTWDTGLNGIGMLGSEKIGTSTQYTLERSYLYDLRGRNIGTTYEYLNHGLPDLFSYSAYDLMGRTIAYKAPNGQFTGGPFVGWDYEGGVLAAVNELDYTEFLLALTTGDVSGNALVDSMTYHQGGALASMRTAPGDVTTTYTYHPEDHRLWTFQVSAPGGPLVHVSYVLDEAGNLRSSTDSSLARTGTFGYDGLHRLTSAHFPNWEAGQESYVYDYDDAGNLTQKGDQSIRYGHGGVLPTAATCIAQVNPAGPEPCHTILEYHTDGQRSAKLVPASSTIDRYDWNQMGRLVQFDRSDGLQAKYTYDHEGKRVRRWTWKLGDPEQSQTELTFDDFFELNLTRGRSLTHVFGAGRRLLSIARTGVTAADFDGTDGSYLYPHADHLGTNTLVTDQSGAIVQESVFKPYGETYFEMDGQGNPIDTWLRPLDHLFTDHSLDPESGLHYMVGRYYDPIAGSFLSWDPEVYGAEASLSSIGSINGYAYARGNPLAYVDPDGHEEVPGDFEGPLEQGDWRFGNNEEFDAAAEYNIAVGAPEEYQTIKQRAEFYFWLADELVEHGSETRWVEAAARVATQMGLTETYPVPEELRKLAQEGNKAIFDDVFPRLGEVYERSKNGDPLVGEEARAWDEQTLYREQYEIVQPIYDRYLSGENGAKLKALLQEGAADSYRHPPTLWPIRGRSQYALPFKGDIASPHDRYQYGLELGRWAVTNRYQVRGIGYRGRGTIVPSTPFSSGTLSPWSTGVLYMLF